MEIKIRPNLNLRTFYVTELNSELQKSQLITLHTNLLETLSPSWQLEHTPIEVEWGRVVTFAGRMSAECQSYSIKIWNQIKLHA